MDSKDVKDRGFHEDEYHWSGQKRWLSGVPPPDNGERLRARTRANTFQLEEEKETAP